MQPYTGTFRPRLDDKGRFFLPAHWRSDFATGLVITVGGEKCLKVFTTEYFREQAEAFRAAASTPAHRAQERALFASSQTDAPDTQGRVTIDALLREYAGLAKGELVVTGANSRLEIRSPQTWQATQPARPLAELAEIGDLIN